VSGELVVTPELAYGSSGKSGAHGFTARQLARIDEALTLSSRESGLTFSVYVGELAAPTRDTANALFSELAAKATAPLLVAVSPGQRVLQIVTGRESPAASRRPGSRTSRARSPHCRCAPRSAPATSPAAS
jgi:hypothetical protein